MRVLVIADPIVPVPPIHYGGTERVVDLMCRGLIDRGYDVALLAGPGSRLPGGRLTVHRAPSTDLRSRAGRKIWFQFISLWAARGADVIVNFGRLDYLAALHRTSIPLIHWFENPLVGTEVPFVLRRRRRRVLFVGVSQSQVREDPAAERFKVVYNAVDLAGIPFSDRGADPPYLLFLGRMTRNKGVHLAIEAARRSGMKLVLAGNVSKEEGGAEYFETSVKPHLGPDCEWVGPYDEALRNRLVAGATALLFPIQWNEPFAVALVEALAGGLPAIAFRRASAPEAIADGKTGFLCDSVDEMAAAVRRVHEISRKECRESVARRFSAEPFLHAVEDLLSRAATA